MKKDIHPEYYPQAQVICGCGNTFTTGSTQPVIKTDICSACHPFFTGEQRIVDTAGQVERFMRRLEKTEAAEEALRARRAKKKQKAAKKAKGKGGTEPPQEKAEEAEKAE
jgi:large subunit ribosomal protein L31